MSAISPFRDDAELDVSEQGFADDETWPATPFAEDHPEHEAWEGEPESWDVPHELAEPAEAFWEEEEPEAYDVLATEEEVAPPIPSSRLDWPNEPPERLAFMRAVYERHFASSKRSKRRFVSDLGPDELDPIEGCNPDRKNRGCHQARKDAAQAARALLAEARAALVAEGLGSRTRIGIVSAYRPAEHQFVIWQGKGRKGGFPAYYRLALKGGVVRPGDYGPKAVKRMAEYIGQYIAAPGFSNHQDGLAIDFGTGEAGRGLRVIVVHDWFHHWLVANAERFGFHPYVKEAWHWTYRRPAQSEVWSTEVASLPVHAGRLEVPRVPLLAGHRGDAPDLVLRWNDMSSVPEELDVVVHLHGFWYPGMKLPRDIEPVSGLDLVPRDGASGPQRSRPTLTVLPKAHYTGVKQKHGPYSVYTFPALVTKDGLTELVRFSLERFAAEVGGAAPRVGRLILTAHSGGGKALLQILRHHDPSQVHVFDALYWPADALADWARERIRRDRAAVQGLDAASARGYMTARGGALRVFYQDRYRGGTRPYSRALLEAISRELAPELRAWYRVEASRYDHFQIPRRYGWRVLADASTDVPEANTERPSQREVDLREAETTELTFEPEGGFEAPAEEALEPEWEPELWEEQEHFEEAEDESEVVGAYGGLSTELEAADLAGEGPGWAAEESALAVLEAPPAPPAAAAGGPGGHGKWVVLVAGFDYERSGVDFEAIALNRMNLLIRRHAAAERKAKASLAHVIDTAPRFILFDFKSGLVRRRAATKPKGTWTWTEIARFQPITSANYTPTAGGRHVFNSNQAGRMSITDVYERVEEIGRTEPGSLVELSFLSHGWVGGPILVNSDEDAAFRGTTSRDPSDKDTRPEKDFVSPTMDAAALANFQAAFDAHGFVWAWGCAFANSPRQVLHRVLSTRKYRSSRLGSLVDTNTFQLTFSREEAEKFFFVDPVFFPTRGANGQFPLTFERTFGQIKTFFRGRLNETYFQNVARAARVPCFGALAGTYADYERGTALPVMVVPTRKPPYADDFTRSIRFYTTYVGVSLDPEGRNYGRYDP